MENANPRPERYLTPFIRADLEEKMVLLSGPRQVGKTTLALRLLGGDETHPAYFNWDYEKDQRRLLKEEFPPEAKLLVFDEIHKFRRWRNWLKGLYDKTKSRRRYLSTGSARLDLYRNGTLARGAPGLIYTGEEETPQPVVPIFIGCTPLP